MKVKTDLRAGYGEYMAEVIDIQPRQPAAESIQVPGSFSPPRPGILLSFAFRWLAERLQALLAWLKERVAGRPRHMTIDPNRWWEIDAFRGLAILMMLVMHFGNSWLAVASLPASQALMNLWPVLKLWASLPLAAYLIYQAAASSEGLGLHLSGNAALLANLTGVALLAWAALWIASFGSGNNAFLFIMGLSMAITYQHARNKPGGVRFEKWLRRGATLFAFGIGLTLLSLLVTPTTPILFGTLHLLGLSTILAYPFLFLPAWAIFLSGVGVVAATSMMPVLAPAGLGMVLGPVFNLAMLDYAPLLPYFGAVLLGAGVGKFYVQGRENHGFTPPDLSQTRLGRLMAWVGQNALPIYLLQWPVFIIGLTLV